MKRAQPYSVLTLLGLIYLIHAYIPAAMPEDSDRVLRDPGPAICAGHIDTAAVLAIAASSSGESIVCACKAGQIIRFGSAPSEDKAWQLPTPADVTAIAAAQGERLAIAGDKNGIVWIVDLETCQIRQRIPTHTGPVFDVAVIRGGEDILSCNPNQLSGSVVCTHSREGTHNVLAFADNAVGTCCCASNLDSDVWIGDSLGRITRFSTQPNAQKATFTARPLQRVGDLRFERPGVLASESPTERYYVRSVAIAPDDSVVAAGYSDGVVRLWNSKTGEEEFTIEIGKAEVFRVAFGDNGSKLVVCTICGKLAIYRISDSSKIAAFELAGGVVSAALMQRDGAAIAFACLSRDGLWQFPLPSRAKVRATH